MGKHCIERKELFMNYGVHLSGKGAAVLWSEFIRCVDECTGTVECLNEVHGGYIEPRQENCTDKLTRKQSPKYP